MVEIFRGRFKPVDEAPSGVVAVEGGFDRPGVAGELIGARPVANQERTGAVGAGPNPDLVGADAAKHGSVGDIERGLGAEFGRAGGRQQRGE